MQRLGFLIVGAASGALLAACGGGMPGTMQQPGTGSVVGWQRQASALGRGGCSELSGALACGVIIMKTVVRPELAGWAPADLQAAYNLPSSSKGKGQIVAIVDAYDNPNVASDLATYRSQFGLPPANFTKYNEHGQQSHYPESCKGQLGNSWCLEIDLDVDMVSAACPNCTIYLVEADSYWPKKSAARSLEAAEREAVKLGAHIVSNSWACSRCWPQKEFEKAFATPGVVYLAASGDFNSSSAEPARFANVVSVGGTYLSKKGTRYREIVWPWTGGGRCARGVAKPSWQHDPSCKYRTQNDIAAVAVDVASYDSYDYGGWITAAGTSVASPLIASVYALAGNASSQHAAEGLWALTRQQRKSYLHAIREGANGSCGGSYICTAGTGQYFTYSGPTGWGTPNGIGAF